MAFIVISDDAMKAVDNVVIIYVSDDAMKAVDNVVINKYKNFTTHNTQHTILTRLKVQVRNEASFHPASDQ